ncbi:gliding motility-associated ABC transporter substrate-binding protein GldG [Croceiramulus getboli]|nr:gliding motility-associated ABC transporter substrate-binding protein GldG [Flavobacteriaceae bacterium YJPT1-3]
MIAILKKEINSFFSSPIAYLVIGIFLVVCGLFLWVFEGQFNIFDFGFADLSPFFLLAPWVFIFLIPAVTMRSFSEERKTGTLELLLVKPLSAMQLVMGKYLGALVLLVLTLLPTLLYVWAISSLGNPEGNYDSGVLLGSYLGLLLLAASYTAIGIFASTLTHNPLIAFILAVFLCFLLYFGLEGLANYNVLGAQDYLLSQLGMQSHYESVSRGVLALKDVLYFLSLILFFLCWTAVRLNRDPKRLRLSVLLLLLGLILINVFAATAPGRIDLTQDQRFTLSETTIRLAEQPQSPVYVEVFLEGEFPGEFRKLQLETRQLLEELNAINSNIQFSFQDPKSEGLPIEEIANRFLEAGMQPARINVRENGKLTEEIIFPWATATHNGQTLPIPLLQNTLGAGPEERVAQSIQSLEYELANAISQLVTPKSKRIAVLKGNGTLEDRYIADLFRSAQQRYYIAPFPVEAIAQNPERALQALKNTFDLLVIAKPTQAFTEEQKFVIDQYIMSGGKGMLLLDAVAMETDSLFASERALAFPRDLNLNDQLFKYGLRINPALVMDMYSAPLTVASGEGSASQYTQLPWPYLPLVTPGDSTLITQGIDRPVKFEYANPIDLLENAVNKTVLLESSALSRVVGTPLEISLSSIGTPPNPNQYQAGPQVLGVLLEGQFTSVFQNRVKPVSLDSLRFRESGTSSLIVFSDGDLIANELDNRGNPMELGLDKFTFQQYGNKELLLNSMDYLIGDRGLINIRNKEIQLAFLDTEKVAAQRGKWQAIALGLPLVFLLIFGLVFNALRKRKYH